MKVRVDPVRCGSAGACVKECPEVFHFTVGSKKAVARMETVPPELEEKCLRAARLCPNGAVIVTARP